MGHADQESSAPAEAIAIAHAARDAEVEANASPTLITPIWNSVLDALALRASTSGAAIALLLILFLVLRETWVGRLGLAVREPRDIYIYVSVVEAVLIGYLVGARASVARAARATLDGLGDALDLTPSHRARLRYDMGRYRRLRFLAAGVVGAVLGVLAPLLIHDATMHPWSLSDWSPEFWLRRTLAPVVGWMFGTYVLASVREAERVSDLALHLRSIDLFDRETLAPFSRFGLQVALRSVGLVSVSALMVAEHGFGLVVESLVLVAALAAAAGLLLPVRGLRERICEEKRRELTCCRDALRRARDALVAGRPVATEHGRVSEVVAYKQLVESIDEWPIDAPTVLRACGYVVLPVLSWFSGSVAPGAVLRIFETIVGLAS